MRQLAEIENDIYMIYVRKKVSINILQNHQGSVSNPCLGLKIFDHLFLMVVLDFVFFYFICFKVIRLGILHVLPALQILLH